MHVNDGPARHWTCDRCAVSHTSRGPIELRSIDGEPIIIMLKNITRSKAIQVWFVTVALAAAAAVAFGASATLETAATLAALCLIPPVIMLMLWPRDLATTAGDVLRGIDRPTDR